VTPEASVRQAEDAIAQAGTERVDVICFPECFVPGYRAQGKPVAPPDGAFLERAWLAVARANVAVILGTERVIQAEGGR
jgi:predicted amidohydrolase